MQEPVTVFSFFASKRAPDSQDSLWNADKVKEVLKIPIGSQKVGYISYIMANYSTFGLWFFIGKNKKLKKERQNMIKINLYLTPSM